MQIIPTSNSKAVSLACNALSRGELVIYPTETCYGLAVDVTNPQAVAQLLTYKGDRHRQVSIAVSSHEMATQFVELNDLAHNLYTHFLPGPLTVISTSFSRVDPRLESSHRTLGVRYPNHAFALKLIHHFGKPVTATSANTSGKKEPYSLTDWRKYTTPTKQAMISLFLDAGQLVDRPTSTVVDTTLNDPTVLRQGAIILPSHSPTFTSSSPAATQHFAIDLTLKHLNLTRRFPLIFALQGELGTGKTQFSKGIATALGISDTINSPTYTLLHEYPYNSPKYQGIFYHLDTWRLPDMAELETTLHLSKLLIPGNILSLEWAGKAKELLIQYQKSCVIIYLNIKDIDQNTRQISYTLSTPEWT
ncbi:MAG: Sua5/YciO/YrdC/YwlC family protein [Microgenomates group bacterium GW2011_GWC2_46_7]|nr:MAG: Sua5/YciO/YrdC/YwlC family protein [Microgenomates group bacterium GW2011_GWC2_46_7]